MPTTSTRPAGRTRGRPHDPGAERLDAFRTWMTRHRGVMTSTLDCYCRVLFAFLGALGADPSRYDAQQVRGFVLDRANGHCASYAQGVATAVRAFLKYVVVVGECAPALIEAVPCIAESRHATLPRFASATDVERIVASPDRRTRVGKRDHAILLLLSRLGLRAGDVAGLRLDDIDWADGSLVVCGKARREERLPLPQDVGDAILAYLRCGRPTTDVDHVFVRVVPPFKPLRSGTVSGVVARAIQRAGVEVPTHGAHLLRHSLATHMLRRGASLEAIARVLRHRSIETTVHYAKVDVGLLSEVAQPWPEVTPW